MRTFIAVEIHNDDVLNAIAKIQSNFKIKATPVNKQNMHFTLLFLGEIDEKTVEDIKNELSLIVFKPIEVKFTHIGAFPNTRFPRVIWIGVDKMASDQLIDLAVQVEKRLEPLGFKSDKPFKPHLTIFRIKTKSDDISQTLEKFKVVDLGKEIITELKLKQSVLTPSGSIYSDLQVVLAK
jgi:RNA 2',3'-cyclic 3'-phosphodiesterase